MGVLDRLYSRIADRAYEKVEQKQAVVRQEDLVKKLQEVSTWDVPLGFNTQTRPQKINSAVSYQQLRDVSVNYPIIRACINYLKGKIKALEWDIVPANSEDTKSYQSQIEAVREFFKTPSGHKSRLRELLDIIIEDTLVLDAVSLYCQRTFKSELTGVIPIDPATIKLVLLKDGTTPAPPERAYEQWIKGQKTADLTTDDMIYEVSNCRSNSPYGLSAIESLMIQVTSALKSALYNLGYLTEGNVPEGFMELPENVATSVEKIKEWQAHYDALTSGDPRFQRKLRAIPGGSKYTPTKKPEDMAFKEFEQWLMEQTCSVFGVPPQDIGFTAKINKATGEIQQQMGQERGLRPLANFIKEIFDDVIQVRLGFSELSFSWQNLNPTDLSEEANVAKTVIGFGGKTLNEYRRETGDEPYTFEQADKPFAMTSQGPVYFEDSNADQNNEGNPTQETAPQAQAPEVIAEEAKQELKLWRKKAIKRIKKGLSPDNFTSDVLDEKTTQLVKEGLQFCTDDKDVKKFMDGFIHNQEQLMKGLLTLYEDLDDAISN